MYSRAARSWPRTDMVPTLEYCVGVGVIRVRVAGKRELRISGYNVRRE